MNYLYQGNPYREDLLLTNQVADVLEGIPAQKAVTETFQCKDVAASAVLLRL